MKKVAISKTNLAIAETELVVLARIKHPRLVQLLDFYVSNSTFNFILEYMSNGSLADILESLRNKNVHFKEPDLLKLFLEIVNGVRFLHSRSIIHRDVKPENVLVGDDHRLKVADFGIAAQHKRPWHKSKAAVGTPLYMAPEVQLGHTYDNSVDSKLP